MTGEAELEAIAQKFLDCGVKHVVIKTGKRGCYLATADGKRIGIPAVKGVKAIDTIGAGDNFVSGFISAILEGQDLVSCARFANATASVSVESIGATTGVTSREQVEERLENYDGLKNK